MKMLNNGLEVDGFATSRTPIQSLPSTKMEEGDLRYDARPPERPVQVHPDHHAEDEAVAKHVAVAEHVGGVDAREKDIKNSCLSSTAQYPCVANVKTRCPLDGNANAPRLDDPPNDVGV